LLGFCQDWFPGALFCRQYVVAIAEKPYQSSCNGLVLFWVWFPLKAGFSRPWSLESGRITHVAMWARTGFYARAKRTLSAFLDYAM